MTNRLLEAQKKREAEQAAIEAQASGKAMTDGIKAPAKGQNTLMLYVSPELKMKLKIYAMKQNRRVSECVREWLEEKLADVHIDI